MKTIKIIFLLALLPALAFGQAVPTGPVRNDSAATTIQSANGGNSRISTDQKGQTFITTNGTPIPVTAAISGTPQPINGTVNVVATPGATSFLHVEDSAAVDADTGNFALGIRQNAAAPGTFAGSTNDYSGIAVNGYGGPLATIDQRMQFSGDNKALLHLEDDAHVSADAGVFSLGVANTNLGAGLCGSNGDYCPIATNVNGAVYVNLAVTDNTISPVRPEDAASANADALMVTGAKRLDSPANSSGTDGDYEPLQISGGLLWTRLRGIQTPLGDSAMDDTNDAVRVNIVAGAGSGGTAMTDDAAYTVGSTSFTPAGGTYLTVRDSVNDGDGGAFAMTATRALYTAIETPLGDSAMDDTNDALRVNIVAGAGSGGTAMTDDAAFTVGSTSITPAGGTYRSVRDSVNDGDGGALAMTATRGLYTTLETPNGDSAMDETNDALKIVAAALPLPSGAATSANQSTEITSLQLIDDAIFAEDAGHVSADKGVQMLGVSNLALTTISGSALDYTPIATDNTGSVLTLLPGRNLTVSALRNEDDAVGDTGGVMMMGTWRQDTLAASSSTDGDATHFKSDSVGAAYVRDRATNFEDVAHASGDAGSPVWAVRNTSAVSYGADQDYSPIAVGASGNVLVSTYYDAAISDANGAVKREDSPATTTSALVNVGAVIEAAPASTAADQDYTYFKTDAISKLWTAGDQTEDLPHASGDRGSYVMAVRQDSAVTSGGSGDYVSIISDVDGKLWTTGSQLEDAVAGSGDKGVFALAKRLDSATAEAANGDYIALITDVNGKLWTNAEVGGNVAHDGVDSGNPVKVGMRAIAHGTNPTAVAAADRTDWLANRAGVPFVIGGHPNVITVAAAYTAAQTDTAVVTVSAGTKIVVTASSFTCDNANTVNVGFYLGFGTANTPTTTGVVSTHPGVAPGSGVVEGSGSGIIGVGADDADLRITSTVPTTGSCRVKVSYYTIES